MRKYEILSEAQETLEEYKKDFLEMNIGSLAAIAKHAQNILSALEQENVKNNLTESWLQGKIAITEDYMKTIHDFVMFVPSDDDEKNMTPASLWENIRKKKLREGKNYKPAKPGDKDRPDKDAWDRAKGEPSEKQKKALDKNKDGKITKEDFELLRKGKK